MLSIAIELHLMSMTISKVTYMVWTESNSLYHIGQATAATLRVSVRHRLLLALKPIKINMVCQLDRKKKKFHAWKMVCVSPAESFFWTNSKAVVRSHIWIAPLLWPDRIKRLGIDPIRDDFSHSCTQKDVIVDPSMDFITHTRSPFDANRTYNWSVSGITFCTNTCSSSCSPNGPKSLPAE